MTAVCFAEGGKIVEVKDNRCSSCGRPIYYRHARKGASLTRYGHSRVKEIRDGRAM